MPVQWTIRYYVRPGNRDDVRDAYDRGSKQLQAKFQSRLKALAQLPLPEWTDPLAKPLQGSCAGLVEIRFKADRVQQRPLGFRSGASEFTIVFWATERGDKFVPSGSCTKALARKAELLNGEALSHALWFALE